MQICINNRHKRRIYLRGHVFGRLYSDGGVPLPGRQHCHLVEKLIDACHQVIPVFGFICNIMENLLSRRGEKFHMS